MGSSSCAPRSKAILPRAGGSATRQRGRRSCCRRATRAAPTSASSNLGIRLVIRYELLDMARVDGITVKGRVSTEASRIDSVVELFPGADFPEREVYDMFGVVFDGHPDLRRILMPEDYEGFPQRRDFPVGGEPVLFTHNEQRSYGQYQ